VLDQRMADKIDIVGGHINRCTLFPAFSPDGRC
jgi:hypothetical protein